VVDQTNILLEEVVMVPIQFFLVLHPQAVVAVEGPLVALNQHLTVQVIQVDLVVEVELS
tara:strand:+ start:296 stop:472 length:177 start_codon:yes stop_codon:yes gene_type:complete